MVSKLEDPTHVTSMYLIVRCPRAPVEVLYFIWPHDREKKTVRDKSVSDLQKSISAESVLTVKAVHSVKLTVAD